MLASLIGSDFKNLLKLNLDKSMDIKRLLKSNSDIARPTAGAF